MKEPGSYDRVKKGDTDETVAESLLEKRKRWASRSCSN